MELHYITRDLFSDAVTAIELDPSDLRIEGDYIQFVFKAPHDPVRLVAALAQVVTLYHGVLSAPGVLREVVSLMETFSLNSLDSSSGATDRGSIVGIWLGVLFV